MSDILTRLLLNTGDYDAKMNKAKKSSNDFASSIGSKAVAAVGKFAAGVGVAMGGVEAFNKMIGSSQTLGDRWNNTLAACKGTVDAFFQSLATSNWGAFNQGLVQTIENMYQLSALKDQLSDARLSMGFEQRAFEREYVKLEGIINDETKSKSARTAAFVEMQKLVADFKTKVEATGKGAAETLVKEMNTKFGQEFTLGDIETYIREVNNEFLNTETLQRLNQYKQTIEDMRKAGEVTTVTPYGSVTKVTKSALDQIDAFRKANPFLEKMRLLQEDGDASRKGMVQDYEYMLELFQRADEYLKRSLEKQTKITSLNKENVVSVEKAVNKYTGQALTQGKTSLAVLAGGLPTTLGATPAVGTKQQTTNVEGYANAINSVANALNAVNTVSGEGAEAFFSWASAVMTSSAQAVQAIQTVIAAKTAEAAASAGASAASTPVVGWLMIGGAIAAALAAFSKIPKFAEGGVVGGSSYVGDKLLARVNSGECVLTQAQQSRALALMDGGNVRVSGDVKLSGKDIYIVLRNHMKSSGDKL